MIKNIAHGYGKLLGSTLKILFLLAACTLLGAAIVYPLWKFATTKPTEYTVTILVLVAATLIFLLIKKIMAAGAKTTLLQFARIAVIAAGIIGSVALVLNGMRLLAIPVTVAAVILYGILSFGYAKK